jgi:parallel beta-helix repeat protein
MPQNSKMRTLLKVFCFLYLMTPSHSLAELAVSVMDASIAKEIKSRTPQGVGSVFPKNVGKLFCYTKIKSNVDNAIKHLWYYEGKLMAEVSLSVKQGEWRTRSSKNIIPEWTGKWRVDITRLDGKLLDSLYFKLVQDETLSDTNVSAPSPTPDIKLVQDEDETLSDTNCSAPSPPPDIKPTFIVSSYVGDDDKADGRCIAYKTISKAIQAAKPNDLIWVAAGIYDAELGENFPIKLPEGVSLIGDPKSNGAGNDSPVISGQGRFIQKSYAAIVGATESIVKGFTIKTGTEFFRFGIISSDADMTITNNTFSDSYGGVYLIGGGNPLIENNIFSSESYGIYIDHAGIAKIQRNNFIEGSFVRILRGSPVIYENSFSGPHPSAIFVQYGSPLIERNTFNSSYTSGAIQLVYRAYPVIRLNTFKSLNSVAINIKGSSLPDLGTTKDPGGNMFTGKRGIGVMLRNNNTVYAVGNVWKSTQVWIPKQPVCGSDIKIEKKGEVVWGENVGEMCM